MAAEVFANQATTVVISGGTDAPAAGTVETWTVASSASFPAASTGVSQFHVTDLAVAGSSEIILVTNVSGTTWTVTRGAEGTTPVVHVAGFTIRQTMTAGFFGALLSTVSPSGDTTGATDVAAINSAILAASTAGGGIVQGAPKAPWYLNAPFVLCSNVTLDMTGCVITEVANSNCNMVTNYSATAAAAATGTGSISSGFNTLTTSLGASATVGQSVYIAGGANGGANLLCGIVGAATGTTITVVDLLGNPLNAGADVSGGAVSLYNRDSQIEVKGGTWNRGANGFLGAGGPGYSPLACGMNYRRTTGLHVHDLTITCTDRGYNILHGDDANFHFHDITVNAPVTKANTDGIHGWGPLAFGTVENIFGTCGDDWVIVDCLDPGLTIDICGNVSDVTISKLYPGQGTSPNGGGGAILIGSGTFTMKRITVEDVKGSSTTYGVGIGSGATGNLADDIVVSRVSNTATSTSVGMMVTGGGNITLRDIAWTGNPFTSTGANMISVQAGSNLGALTIDGLSLEATSTTPVGLIVNSGATVTSLIVENVNRASGDGEIVQIDGTVTVLSINGMQVVTTDSSPAIYVGSSATVGKLHLVDVYFKGSSAVLFSNSSTATIGQVLINACTLDGANYLADASVAMDFIINGLNVQGIASTQLIWLNSAGATVVVRGAGIDNPSSITTFGNTGTPSTKPRIVGAEFLADASTLNRSFAGDIVNNTNGGLACGTGVVLSSGSGSAGSWKNLFSGSTY